MLLNRRRFCRDVFAGVGAAGLGLHTVGSPGATLGGQEGQTDPLTDRFSAQSDWLLNGRYDHWGFDAAGERYKRPERIVQLLVETTAARGNLILDVAPNATGQIEPRSAANLRKAGEWTARNGDSIYGTKSWGRIYYNGVYATTRGNNVYLHVFDWKPGTSCDFPLLGIKSASRVYFLGYQDDLHLNSTPVGLRLMARNPNSQPSPDTVVVFENVVRASAEIESVPL
jgi:hypothetical protein